MNALFHTLKEDMEVEILHTKDLLPFYLGELQKELGVFNDLLSDTMRLLADGQETHTASKHCDHSFRRKEPALDIRNLADTCIDETWTTLPGTEETFENDLSIPESANDSDCYLEAGQISSGISFQESVFLVKELCTVLQRRTPVAT